MDSYQEVKWRLKQKHIERLDKIKFLEQKLQEKDEEIARLKEHIKQKNPFVQEPKKETDPELKEMADNAKRLLAQREYKLAEKMMSRLKVKIALKEARKLVEIDPIRASQKLVEAQQIMAESNLPAEDLRKFHFEIKEIKTDIELQRV